MRKSSAGDTSQPVENYTCEVSLGNDVGNVRYVENLTGNQKIPQHSASLDKTKNDLEEAKSNMLKPFERAVKLVQTHVKEDHWVNFIKGTVLAVSIPKNFV